jgi:DNA-binding transcriptional MerR regulator
MKPHEVAALVGIHENTVRAWSSGEYKRYLNHAAQGGSGRTRDFDNQDVQVIAFINTLKRKNTPADEIHMRLQQLEAEEWQDLPPLEQGPTPTASFPVVPQAAAETALDAERKKWTREIAMMSERIEKLEEELAGERGKREELIRQLAEAQTELRLYQQGRILPPKAE